MGDSRSEQLKSRPAFDPVRLNNLYMAALLWALRNSCTCKACERLRKAAELLEQSMEVEGWS